MARAKKFGAFGGVFTPSILTILGVIMFLRLPWIVGQAGLWSTLGIILVAHIISLSTGLSVSSVATDKRVGTGGSYYIISRTLGLPIGGTLGIALFIGLSFSVSLYLIGFAETFLSYFGFEVSLYTIRIAGSIILLLVAVLTFISTSLAIKTQYLIMTAMVLSLISVFVGRHGFVPAEPLLMPVSGALPWIALFAIFFPAVTGFEAGVSMSGDLKDPRKHIPIGTISAILVGLAVYVGLAFFFSYTVDRELLTGDPGVLLRISWIPQLVIAGILGATLSSALGSILGAPRILQSVGSDRIIPSFFATGFGASNEPRNALILTYLIAQAGILIGELNAIARIVTIFFIITYGFLNITYTLESWAGTDFRPTFKIPGFVSIIGALACVIVMIQLDVIALIFASLALIALFLFLKRRELTLQTGDTWNSIWASVVKTGLRRLTISSRKPSNWRPNVLLFSGGETHRPYLIEMGKSLVGKLGIFTNFELIEEPMTSNMLRKVPEQRPANYSVKAGVFSRYHECRDIYEGIELISKVYGFSGFEPNTILMGWARKTRNPEKFAGLLSSFRSQDLNAVFLHYDKHRGFGKQRNIDVWWSGRGRNLSLAITLIKFLTSSKEWRGARIRILTINYNTSVTESLYNLMNQVLDNQRIQARVKVVNNNVEQLPEHELITSESGEMDLCILELPEFSRQDPRPLIEKVNRQTEMLGSCLIISASGFFDELTVKVGREEKEGRHLPHPEGRPEADILKNIHPASKEIITNEVSNIGSSVQVITERYFESGLEPILEKRLAFVKEFGYFIEKILASLGATIAGEKVKDKDKALLRLLNDFSYHSRKYIQELKENVLSSEMDLLEKANEAYTSGLWDAMIEVPERIWIKRAGGEFSIHKADTLFTKVYKTRKKLLAIVLGKSVSHRIDLHNAAKYFILHRRLELLLGLMHEFAGHAYQQVTEIRKLLVAVHESIEKTRKGSADLLKMSEYIRLERQRLMARISVMQDDEKHFCYALGQKLFQSLLDDLNKLTDHLDSTQASLLTKNFKVLFRQHDEMVDAMKALPGKLQKNHELFINKVLLDFYVLSLKSRVNSKIQKYHHEFKVNVEHMLLSVIHDYQSMSFDDKKGVRELGKKSEKLDHSKLLVPSANEKFESLFEEIRDLLREIPEIINIGGDHSPGQQTLTHFPEPSPILIHFRKVISMYIGKEFIDPAKKLTLEFDQQLQQSVASIRDLVRLMNFSLSDDEGIEADIDPGKRAEQKAFMIQNFHHKLSEEEIGVRTRLEAISSSFTTQLKTAFDPLSAATIGKSGDEMTKKIRQGSRWAYFTKTAQAWERFSGMIQRQFVNLLYSRSEGMIWFRHLERSVKITHTSHKDTLDFADQITPLPSVVKELPFYYCSLFSGQAGIGDDFWVGMKEQVSEADQAIGRFKMGHGGALIVTGARSSGKSSLSKLIARKHFPAEHIHQVRAPQTCTANLTLFTARLQESLQVSGKSVDDVFYALPTGKAVIIQDLALWWERKPGGAAVIEFIKSLVEKFGHKCLFIITVNSHALPVIDHWSKLKGYALATITCDPFDARELKELLMLRHKAGGMTLYFNRKSEDRMTAWDFARMFNTFFNYSFGNPGTAILLWMASIKKVSGKSIYMETPVMPAIDIFDKLTKDQWFYIMQFVIHRRFSIDTLSENLNMPYQQVYHDIRELERAGLLIEKFQGVYAIRPGMDLYLTEKLKTLNRS